MAAGAGDAAEAVVEAADEVEALRGMFAMPGEFEWRRSPAAAEAAARAAGWDGDALDGDADGADGGGADGGGGGELASLGVGGGSGVGSGVAQAHAGAQRLSMTHWFVP